MAVSVDRGCRHSVVRPSSHLWFDSYRWLTKCIREGCTGVGIWIAVSGIAMLGCRNSERDLPWHIRFVVSDSSKPATWQFESLPFPDEFIVRGGPAEAVTSAGLKELTSLSEEGRLVLELLDMTEDNRWGQYLVIPETWSRNAVVTLVYKGKECGTVRLNGRAVGLDVQWVSESETFVVDQITLKEVDPRNHSH